MFQLILVIALTSLIVMGSLCAYFFGRLRASHNDDKEETNNLGKSRKRSGSTDLQAMAKLLDSGGPQDARLVIKQLAHRKLKGDKKSDFLALKIRAFCKLKEYNDALYCALELSQQQHYGHFMTETELIESLAVIYSALNHTEKAYNEYLVLIQKFPENVEYIFEAASNALEMKQYETSIALFERLLKLDPNHQTTLCKLGRIFYEKKLYAQALEYLNRAYSSNYDSNELRYFLALTLMQTSGKDAIAQSLLQRVSRDPVWAKRTLPRLAVLSSKVGDHQSVITSVKEFRSIFAKASSDILLNELTLLQANAHRMLHEVDKACELWRQIVPVSAHYEEAQENIRVFQPFTTAGVFYDYLHSESQAFVNLCTKICDYVLKQSGSNMPFSLSGYVLKIIKGKCLHPEDGRPAPSSVIPLGAAVSQSFQERWDSISGKIARQLPTVHIFLRLDQKFDDVDLQFNLQEMGIDNNYDKVINVYIYSIHYVSPSMFTNNIKCEVHLYRLNEFHKILQNFERSQTGGSKKSRMTALRS